MTYEHKSSEPSFDFKSALERMKSNDKDLEKFYNDIKAKTCKSKKGDD